MKSKVYLDTKLSLLSEWDYERNNNLDPSKISIGSHVKAWWKCSIDSNHVWFAQVKSRSKHGCPHCSAIKRGIARATPKYGNSLGDLFPELALEWHPTKNAPIEPNMIKAGTSKKYWWKCKINPNHCWQANAAARTKGNGCPYCSGRTVSENNSLAVKRPDVASEWHPFKNPGLNPFEFGVASNKKVWWKCPKGDDHEWQSKISNRTSLNQGCSICANQTIVNSNCLTTTHPDLAKEWDITKNLKSPNEVVAGSHTKYFWKCIENSDHPSYPAAVNKRILGRKCPKCGRKKRGISKARPKEGNSFGDLFPELLNEWYYEKNGNLDPFGIKPSTPRKAWWKCPKGADHIWYSEVRSRVNGMGCSICRGLKVVDSNCLATTYPFLVEEWHPTKNENITPYEVHFGSHKKVWWQCKNNKTHPAWKAAVKDRTQRNFRCNYCWPTKQSKEELIILFELKWIFNEISESGYNVNINGKKWSIDIYIEELKLAIEYDGNYWHGKKENIDKKKSLEISNHGINIIRIRPLPLEKINNNDIEFSGRFNGKSICNKIFNYILSNFTLSEIKTKKIQDYFISSKLKNTKEFQIYICNFLGDKRISKFNVSDPSANKIANTKTVKSSSYLTSSDAEDIGLSE
ncbi:MAG: zinc-ribbon domain-containing protein [Bacteroidota bacterium]